MLNFSCSKSAISRRFKSFYFQRSSWASLTLFSDVVLKLSDYSRLMHWLAGYSMSIVWSNIVLQKIIIAQHIRTCFARTPSIMQTLVKQQQGFIWTVGKKIMLGRKLSRRTFKTKEIRAGLVRVLLFWKSHSVICVQGPAPPVFASQHNLFCTMWPDRAKGLLQIKDWRINKYTINNTKMYLKVKDTPEITKRQLNQY